MKNFLVFILSLSLWSCQDVKRPEKPENLIPEEEMVAVLTEVYLINAARSFDNRTILDKQVKLDSFIYIKFNIDSLQFAQSNAYYTANLNNYNSLFQKVEERMSLLKTSVDSIHEIILKQDEEKRILDSINGVKKDSPVLIKKDTVIKKPQLIEPQSTLFH